MKSNISTQLQELESIASALNIDVIFEKIKTIHPRKGGLCFFKGKYRLYIEKKTSISERLAILIENIALFDLDDIFISPKIREILTLKKVTLKEKGKTLPR